MAVLRIDNPPVNASTARLRADLITAIDRAAASPGVDAVVLIGTHKYFVTGSDLSEFECTELPEPQLPRVIDAIARCPKPVVAALAGPTLGGGLELALGCDIRVAAETTTVGLPEVTLGMMPGAGGTQRLPRLVGVARALDLVCTGKRLRALEARDIGILDEIVTADEDLLVFATNIARQAKCKRILLTEPVPADAAGAIEETAAAILQDSGARPPVITAMGATLLSVTTDSRAALRFERAEFHRLRLEADARALRHVFFAERMAARSDRGGEADSPARSGFGSIGDRLVSAYTTQCHLLAAEGVHPDQIDTALDDFGFPLGPFRPARLCGPDIHRKRRVYANDEIVRRALAAMANEASLILADQAIRADDIDVMMVHHYGFPRHQGGPVFWARQQSIDSLTEILDQIVSTSGSGYRCGDLTLLMASAASERTL